MRTPAPTIAIRPRVRVADGVFHAAARDTAVRRAQCSSPRRSLACMRTVIGTSLRRRGGSGEGAAGTGTGSGVARSPASWAPSGVLSAPDGHLWILENSTTSAARVRRIPPMAPHACTERTRNAGRPFAPWRHCAALPASPNLSASFTGSTR